MQAEAGLTEPLTEKGSAEEVEEGEAGQAGEAFDGGRAGLAAVHVHVVVEDAAGVPEGEALHALQAGLVGEV